MGLERILDQNQAFKRAAIFGLVGLVALVALLPARVLASGGDAVPGSRYVSGRGAAMGDAFIAFADDGASALFYNPAAIARLKEFHFEPINLQLQANHKLMNNFGTDGYKFTSLPDYASKLNDDRLGTHSGSAALLPNISFQGFAVGMLLQSRLRAYSDGTNIHYRSVYQLIPAAGFGLRLASGVLRLGYVLQWVNQASGDRSVAASSSTLGWNQGLSEGSGFSHNLGLALTLPYHSQPAFNLVVRNAGGMKLSGKSIYKFAEDASATEQPKEEMSMDGAFSFLAKIGSGNELRTSVQYRDATNSSNMPVKARVSLGTELSLRDRFYVRGGLGSGYPTAGIGVKTNHSEVNLTWFSEEMGTDFRQSRDIRYLFQYQLKLF